MEVIEIMEIPQQQKMPVSALFFFLKDANCGHIWKPLLI